MRYTRYIAAFVALILAASCTISDIDDTPINTVGSKGQLQVVGRVTQYSDCNVATRSKKEGDEPKVTSMGLALFPIDDDGTIIGDCLYYDFKLGGSIVFIVDRHDDVFNNYVDKRFAMYIFANMQDAKNFPTTSEAGVGKSLAYFKQCAYDVPVDVEKVPANGFPMMGSLGDYVSKNGDELLADGKTLILKPEQTDANVDGLPMVDGVATDNLEIPLKSMYAKFTFTISSKPDQEIVGNKAPRFDLVSYSVHNIPSTVDADSSTNDDADVLASSVKYSGGGYAQGATTATLDFYLPERKLTPAYTLESVLPKELKKGTYDTTVDKDQNGYRDEDERYHQRFKNLLPGDAQKATYITIEGKYTDHQGNAYDVSYNIYLGGNNTDNFDIIRNTHYINSVAIRGISASIDMAENQTGISIDWRVDIERSTPLVISFRREALLDAHYEVRPMRLRLVGDSIPTGTSATVTVLNQDGTANDIPAWIRLEASGTTADHITDGVSKGKRKYFTTNLVTETLAGGTSVTVEKLTGDNQAVWVYVDENTDTKSRAAIVRVSYDGVDKDYKIVQQGLYEVKGKDSGRTYYIEQYEEYLYNYDAEDSYGQTKQEGMQWGLDEVQLSNEHYSFNVSLTPNVDWAKYDTKGPRPYYDFYTWHQDSVVLMKAGIAKSDDRSHDVDYVGQHFTQEIFDATKNNSDVNKKVNVLTMADQPKGAVEYCYNRNKRDANGNVEKVEWYLPSADELEDFIVPAYASFEEFQDNYYWTSQPAYIRNVFYYEYQARSTSGKTISAPIVYDDNTLYARATKIVRKYGAFVPAKSGLNFSPTPDVNRTPSEEYTNVGYFDKMHYYKRYYKNILSSSLREEYGPDKLKDENRTGDEQYTHNGKYFFHLQIPVESLIEKTNNGEHGYHERTRYNRVRCVRVKPAQTQQ